MARPLLLLFASLVLAIVLAACGSEEFETPAVGTTPKATPGASSTEALSRPPTPTAAQPDEGRAATKSGDRAPAEPTPSSVPTTVAIEVAIPTEAVPTAPATRSQPTPTPTPTPSATAVPTPEIIRVSRSLMTRDKAPDVPDADLATLVESNNAFAFELYRAISGTDGNLFFSPHSISTALAMAYAGARGETELQMAETLRFDLPQDRLHSAFNALDLSMDPGTEADEAFRLNAANSVWGQEGYDFLPEFLDSLAMNYGDEVRPADFRRDPEGARVRINDWVADETEQRITNLIPPDAISDLTRMVLANAIYFNAAWSHPFEERATTDRPFHLLDGTQREAPMMRQQENLRYADGDGYQAVELHYEGGEMSMAILVPDSGRFEEFEYGLSGRSIQGVVDSLDYELVRLTMPKFETESTLNLSDTLIAMGMPDAFDEESANFSGMDGQLCKRKGDICLLISDVLHKAFVAVDEAGTEAAAATAVIVGITRGVSIEPEPIELVVDRPFLFIIRHLGTGAVLFVGRVLSP